MSQRYIASRVLRCRTEASLSSHRLRTFVTKRQRRAGVVNGEPAGAAPQNNKLGKKTIPLRTVNESGVIVPRVDFDSNLLSKYSAEDDSQLSVDQTDLYDPDIHLASAPKDWTGYEQATPLWHDLSALIGVTGKPISTAEYMRSCLQHPVHGYYVNAGKTSEKDDFDADEYGDSDNQEIIGPGGDFVTAPELSQVFGECLGIWFYTQHKNLEKQTPGKAIPFQWLEFGPGKGTLMADLLRFSCQGKLKHEFGRSLRHVHLIESSPALRQVQEQSLSKELEGVVQIKFCDSKNIDKTETVPSSTVCVYWHDSFAAFQVWQAKSESQLVTYAVGQEFLDALPAYQFEKTSAGSWAERLVDVALRADLMEEDDRQRLEASLKSLPADTKTPRLRIVLAPEITAPLKMLLKVDDNGFMKNEPVDALPGAVVEVSPEAILTVQDVAKLIDKQGGSALWIDYGQAGTSDTIRGFSRHKQVHFLSQPGLVDVTVDVDFKALEHAVNTLNLETKAFGPVDQGQFLVSMGASERVIQLIESDTTTEEQAEDLYQSLVRLVDPSEMGERFKVLSVAKSTAPPPAFESLPPPGTDTG